MIPRFLYHGTSGFHHESIVASGIQPRVRTGNTNWNGKFESSDGHVYLTDTYPLFFAANALTQENFNCIIYEIDTALLDASKLCADEDVLALWMREECKKLAANGNSPEFTLPMLMADARKQMNAVCAERSLEALGTCAYSDTVPTKAIRRALNITANKAAELILRGMDPVINFMNYKFMGAEYREALQWMFQETEKTGVLMNVEYDERFTLWNNPDYVTTE